MQYFAVLHKIPTINLLLFQIQIKLIIFILSFQIQTQALLYAACPCPPRAVRIDSVQEQPSQTVSDQALPGVFIINAHGLSPPPPPPMF